MEAIANKPEIKKEIQSLPEFSLRCIALDKLGVSVNCSNDELTRMFYAYFTTLGAARKQEIVNCVIFAFNEAEKIK